MDLRYESKEPLYAKIINSVLGDINSGTLKVGDKLPTEDELQAQFGVSRGTVRRALSELESMGLVIRRPALGTFVISRTPRLTKELGIITSFSQQLKGAHKEPDANVRRRRLIKASEAEGRVLEAFEVAGDAEVVHIERVRLGNGEPFAIQSVYLTEEFRSILDEQDLKHLFPLYQECFGRTMTSADERISVRGASPQEAELLEMAPGEPVLIRDRISYDQDGRPFEVLHSVDRGDRFVYRYHLVNDRSEVASSGPAGPQ